REIRYERLDRLVVRTRLAPSVPARGSSAERTGRAACGRRGPLPCPAPRSVPARHLPLVLAWSADSVVVSRSARRTAAARDEGVAKPGQVDSQSRLRNPYRYGLSRSAALLRKPGAAPGRHLALARD